MRRRSLTFADGGLVWSGRSSTWRCAAASSWSCSASARRRPTRSRSCIAPRARGATPPASTAPHAPEGPGAACGAEPPAPTGAVVGVPGATRDAAALAPAHGGPALDLPIQIQGPTSDIRTGAAAGRAACPRESAVGLPADPWRAVAAWLAGVASSIRRILCAHGLDPAPRCGRHGVGCRGRECGRRGRADSPDVLAAGIPAQGKREPSGRAEQWGRTAAREYQRLAPRYLAEARAVRLISGGSG